jgi:hypothetical protein
VRQGSNLEEEAKRSEPTGDLSDGKAGVYLCLKKESRMSKSSIRWSRPAFAGQESKVNKFENLKYKRSDSNFGRKI